MQETIMAENWRPDKFNELLWGADIDVTSVSNPLECWLIGGSYSGAGRKSTLLYVSEVISAGGTKLASGALSSITITSGVLSASTVSIPSVTGTIVAVMVVAYTGNNATSPVVYHMDTEIDPITHLNKLPLVAAGATINQYWDAAGITTIRQVDA
jgi:hypothetical protein